MAGASGSVVSISYWSSVMPKVKPRRGSTPPPMRVVIKDVPLVVAPDAKAKPASTPVKDEPKPHYY